MPDELISGATDTQYVPTDPADLGRFVYCRVRGDNAFGFSTANSNTIGPIAAASAGFAFIASAQASGQLGPITTSVIDTTGAAAIVAGYLSDASPWPKRMAPLYRSMSRPKFTVFNNRLWLDAIFVRDYHGNDSSVFTAGSDKNGMSPADWTGGVQGIPDKNDISRLKYISSRIKLPTGMSCIRSISIKIA